MNFLSQRAMHAWLRLGTRFLPFADAATLDLPLSRLLRLSLFQVSVGMALVLLIGTLNRVMIVELGVPASLVGVMISLPLLFAPFRALIGFKSDTHRSELGWRRVPFMYRGAMLQFGGFAIMPFALLVLSGGGEAANGPVWVGHVAAVASFLLVGMGRCPRCSACRCSKPTAVEPCAPWRARRPARRRSSAAASAPFALAERRVAAVGPSGDPSLRRRLRQGALAAEAARPLMKVSARS